jgi:hypothetical protein
MKKLLAVLVLVLFGTMTYAQWQGTTPGNLYMTQGNVGIGITNPQYLLQLYKSDGPTQFVMNTTMTPAVTGTVNLGQYDMRFNGTVQGTGDFYRNVLRKNNNNGGHIEMMQTLHNAAGTTMNFLYVDLNTAKFEIQSGVGTTEFLNVGPVLFNNLGGVGAVGIGTTAIASGVKLQVGGKVKCQEVEVAVTPWPDHVFKAGFNLMPLDEVATFVQTNKHLPGVPSEEEVAANGVSIGKMNATLLQKVEELTLYMIDLKNQNDALKARVSNLEK